MDIIRAILKLIFGLLAILMIGGAIFAFSPVLGFILLGIIILAIVSN